MFSLPQESARPLSEEDTLRSALDGSPLLLWKLPVAVEEAFRRYGRERVAMLVRKALIALFALHALVLLPVWLYRDDPSLPTWAVFAGAPVGTALFGLWLCTLLPRLEDYVEILVGATVGLCLTATLYCGMRLDGQYFGELAQYEVIYVLLVALIVLPAHYCVLISLSALAVALPAAWASSGTPAWLELLLYFFVPLLICTVIGFVLDHSERRNFVQTQLLNRESRRLAQLNAQAEESIRQQRHTSEFLTLINGNLSLEELCTRTLRFLVEHTGAQVGMAYHLGAHDRLRCVASWAADATTQEHRKELALAATLMGPALQRDETLLLENVRADYLPLNLGMGTLPCAHILVLPITQAGRALAVIELGKVTPFAAADRLRADALRTHLAYAVDAANAREMARQARAG